jgi:hypothetical protein
LAKKHNSSLLPFVLLDEEAVNVQG